jgi:hypothetical protein
MDGKRKIFIVIFLNCIQVVSRMEQRKPGANVFDGVLISSSASG